MVRENECSSYLRFEFTSDFHKEVFGIVRDNKSSSYPVFKLPGVNCITEGDQFRH